MDTTQREDQTAKCSLCGELPDELIVNTGRDERFPAACYKLVPVGGESTSQGMFSQTYRCPECGAYFDWEVCPQMYGSGINAEERLIRVLSDPAVRNRSYGPSRQEQEAADAKWAAQVDAAAARGAFRIMEKRFASAGVVMNHNGAPKDWSDFCSLCARNLIELLKKGFLHAKLLKALLAELVDFMEKSFGQDSDEKFYRLLGAFDARYTWLEPFLPESQRSTISIMEERLEEMRAENEDEAERFRQGQMSY